MTERVRIINRADRLDVGFFTAAAHIIRELYACRDHILTNFRQDFRNLSHGTVFGVAWNVILPLVPVLIYAMLSLHRIVPTFEDVDPATYVAVGVTIWLLLAGCIQQPVNIVRARNAEVMKTALPLSAMVASGFAQILFDTGVRILLVAIFMIVTATQIGWTALLIPVVLLPAIMMALGLGLILGVANVIYADVGRVTAIAVQYGIFLSGVIFPIDILPMSAILRWNPAYVFIEETRELLFHSASINPWLIVGYAVFGIAVFLFGCRIFYLMEYRVRGIA